MEAILSALLSFLLLYKYVGLFGVAYLAALAIPLPASSILAAAGAFAAQGYFNIAAVISVAFLGNVSGDMTGYFLTRYYGTKLIKKSGFEKILSLKLYKKLEDGMQNFSHTIIFFSRFLTGVGPLVNLLSGLTQVRFRQYLTFELLGETTYVLLYGLVGYFLGSEWENNIGFLFEATLVIVVLAGTIGVIQYGLFKKIKAKGKN